MKIGIVTVYDSLINYGSFLQAYAMKDILESYGNEVYFIKNFTYLQLINLYRPRCFVDFSNRYNFTKKVWRIFKKNAAACIRLMFTFKSLFYMSRDWKHLNIIRADEIESKKIDVVVCGSDELWNFNNKSVASDFYFCKNIKVKKIAIAISCGDTALEQIPSYPEFAKNLRCFEYIAARDRTTRNIVNSVLGTDIDMLCDPTLLVDRNKLQNSGKIIKSRYIIVYAYSIPENIKRHIIRFAKEKDLKIVTPLLHQKFADRVTITSAFDFGTLIRNAEYVYTSTFHGSIFTIINYKKAVFGCEKVKTTELLNYLGQEQRMISESVSYEIFYEKINLDINSQIIEKRLREIKIENRMVLDKIISREVYGERK